MEYILYGIEWVNTELSSNQANEKNWKFFLSFIKIQLFIFLLSSHLTHLLVMKNWKISHFGQTFITQKSSPNKLRKRREKKKSVRKCLQKILSKLSETFWKSFDFIFTLNFFSLAFLSIFTWMNKLFSKGFTQLRKEIFPSEKVSLRTHKKKTN